MGRGRGAVPWSRSVMTTARWTYVVGNALPDGKSDLDDRRGGDSVKARRRDRRASTHHRADHHAADVQRRTRVVARDHVGAVTGRARQHDRIAVYWAVEDLAQREDRRM